MNYIFPLLALVINISLFVLYTIVRQNARRPRPTEQVPRGPIPI
ncbi:hypothetical protein [Bradyrhizobium canariense]|nr:hypothetical protein [Bradyrhizobium canariense]